MLVSKNVGVYVYILEFRVLKVHNIKHVNS